MPEAYEVGITLALQDGVSAGIELIQRDLAVLDRAIAATSQNLAKLQAEGGGVGDRPLAQPVSPQSNPPFQPSKTDQGANSDNAAVDTTTMPATAGFAALVGRQERDVVSDKPQAPMTRADRTLDPTSRNASQAGVTRIPNSSAGYPREETTTTAAPPTSSGVSAPTPLTGGVKASGAGAATDLLASPSIVAPPTQRRMGPVAPQQSREGLDRISGDEDVPRRSSPAIEHSPIGSRIAAPRLEVGRQPGGATAAEPSRAASLLARPVIPEPAGSAREAGANTPAYRTILRDQHPLLDKGTASRSSSLGATPDATSDGLRLRQTVRPDDTGVPQTGSVAPPASSSQTIHLQGDIIIDGSRLGRWMTSSLARQASRPPSSPIAPDPRQTPLWSGQAQGF